MDEHVNWTVKQQKGTLKAIANPADTFVLKLLSTIRAIERNKAVRGTVDFLTHQFPGEIASAKTRWTGRGHEPLEPRDRAKGLIVVWKGGRRVGYDVDRYIADAVNQASIGHNRALMTALNLMTGAPIFRPLFTTFNPGFQAFNVVRDFRRFWRNTPGLTLRHALALYKKGFPVAAVRAYGSQGIRGALPRWLQPKKGPTTDQSLKDARQRLFALEDAKILNVTYNDMTIGYDAPADAYIERVFAQSGLREFEQAPRRHALLRPIMAVLDVIREAGDLIETLPKVAAADYFRGDLPVGALTPAQRQFIRTSAGSPDFLAGGTMTPATNKLFLYSNAIAQGIRSDYAIARHPGAGSMPPIPPMPPKGGGPSAAAGGADPWAHRASGFWWKTASTVLLPRLIMYAALLGAFGEVVRRILQRGASEYDRTNYLVVPLGEDGPNGVVLRVPDDETNRFLGGLFWKSLQAAHGDRDVWRTLQQVLSYTGGQLPSQAPVLEAAPKVGQFLAGQNPYDYFRGRHVLTDQEARAGGWPAAKKFIGYEFQELGGGIVWKFYAGEQPPRTETRLQRVLSLPVLSNVIGRWVKSTNYGAVEALRTAQADAARTESRQQLREREAINDALETYVALPATQQTPDHREQLALDVADQLYADDQAERARRLPMLRTKIRVGALRGTADPYVDAVLGASSNAQQVAILQEMATQMDATAFDAWLQFAVQEGVISKMVYGLVRDVAARPSAAGVTVR